MRQRGSHSAISLDFSLSTRPLHLPAVGPTEEAEPHSLPGQQAHQVAGRLTWGPWSHTHGILWVGKLVEGLSPKEKVFPQKHSGAGLSRLPACPLQHNAFPRLSALCDMQAELSGSPPGHRVARCEVTGSQGQLPSWLESSIRSELGFGLKFWE